MWPCRAPIVFSLSTVHMAQKLDILSAGPPIFFFQVIWMSASALLCPDTCLKSLDIIKQHLWLSPLILTASGFGMSLIKHTKNIGWWEPWDWHLKSWQQELSCRFWMAVVLNCSWRTAGTAYRWHFRTGAKHRLWERLSGGDRSNHFRP